jgi:hypothetical protein
VANSDEASGGEEVQASTPTSRGRDGDGDVGEVEGGGEEGLKPRGKPVTPSHPNLEPSHYLLARGWRAGHSVFPRVNPAFGIAVLTGTYSLGEISLVPLVERRCL